MATETADNKKLFDAINEVRNSEIKAKEIKGKSYLYVKDRNSIFRKHFGLDVSYHSSYELTDPKVFNYIDKNGKEKWYNWKYSFMSKDCEKARNVVLSTIIVLTVIIIIISNIWEDMI